MKAHALVAILALASCRRGETKTIDGDQAPEDEVWLSAEQMATSNIHVAEVGEREVRRTLDVGGHLAFDDLRVTHVFSPVTGRVTRVLAKPGERLKRGAPLVAILSPDVGAAFADVLKAQADLQTSEADFRREARLLAEDATSRRSYDAAEDAFRRAKAESDRANQRASLLRTGAVDAVTQEYLLRTAIDGEVIARNVNPGFEVVGQYAGGTSLELFTIGDIKDVWVYADVPDRDLPRVGLGSDVAVSVIAYPGRVFHGKVDYISKTVDPVTRSGRIRATLPNATEELKPEMLASVAVAQPAERLLVAPHDAVVAINEQRYVYVEAAPRADGRRVFKRRAVTVGEERDGWIPVRDGVRAGERVVTEGAVARAQPNDEVWPTPSQIARGRITTAEVRERDIPDAVAIGGRLTFDDTRISHVFSPVNGRIARLLAAPGQHVAKGAPLAAILSPDVATYMSDLAKAEADRTQADHEYQRQQELYGNHIGAKRDLEAAEDALRRARAEYDRAKQLAELVKSSDFDTVSQEFVLRSPIAGDVIARKANVGLEVQGQYSNGGNNAIELFTVGELGQLWVLGDVYEMDLPRVTEGETVAIRVSAYPERTFHGRVEWVADVLDPALHTAKVRCVVDNADHLLKPEMYESIEISVPVRHVLAVPREAVMRVEGETYVFVQAKERKSDGSLVFKRRKVVAKLDTNAATVPVLSGLAAGETVAVEHALMLLGMLSS